MKNKRKNNSLIFYGKKIESFIKGHISKNKAKFEC